MASFTTFRFMALLVTLVVLHVVAEQEAKPDDDSLLESYINKKYREKECDKNFGLVLEKLGVGIVKRTGIKALHPTMVLTHLEPGKYELRVISLNKKHKLPFELNKEAHYKTIDGREVNAVITLDKNVLTENESWVDPRKGPRAATVIRDYEDNLLLVTMKVDDTTALCTFEEVKEN